MNTRRGLYSYEALQSRLAANCFAHDGLVDLSGSATELACLAREELFVPLQNIRAVMRDDADALPDRAIERMFAILEGEDVPTYLNDVARGLLGEARRNYARFGSASDPVARRGERHYVLATRVGTVKTATLALALRAFGFVVSAYDGFLEVAANRETPPLTDVLRRLADDEPIDPLGGVANLQVDKFHPYLSRELLEADALSSRLDPEALPAICDRLSRRRTIALSYPPETALSQA